MQAVKRDIMRTLETDGPQDFEELVAATHADEDGVDEAIAELQNEEQLAYSGRHGAFVTIEGDCAVCGRKVTEIECQRVTVSDATDVDADSEEYVLDPHCRRTIFGSWE